MRNFYSYFLFLISACSVMPEHIECLPPHLSEKEMTSHSRPLYDVFVLGAPASGSLVEGILGSVQKGCRHRFHCHSASPAQGFLGPQTIAEPLSLKDQPGVFPAPLMGPASLSFCFNCYQSGTPFTPAVVRPDGTIFYGQPMTDANSTQTLVIASPAQTGIYTLFILAHEEGGQVSQAHVKASISTQPQEEKTFFLQSFEKSSAKPESVSAEFIYTQSISRFGF